MRMNNKIKLIFLSTALLFASGTALATGGTNEVTASDNKRKELVQEVFWYGCVHCYHMEQLNKEFIKKNEKDLEFEYIHGVGGSFQNGAILYYTLSAMGEEDKLRDKIFNEIFEKNRKILGPLNERNKFLEENGIDVNKFEEVSKSFAVQTAMQKAASLQDQYKINGTPSYIVKGQVVSPSQTGGYVQTLDKIKEIIEKN